MSEESNKKLSIDPYKGVRDFYPKDQAVQNYLFSKMRQVAESYGYVEYGASVLEPADLYRAKSGEEIVNEQTYTFTDRGDREVTLRPEMTPTVARMIAAKRKEMQFPVRWYSIPNLFRYEQPQKGRLREHWQLNVDIFGIKGIEPAVEIISLASNILRSYKLQDTDFEIRINNRKIMNFIFNNHFKLNEADTHKISKLIDRKEKMSAEDFSEKITEIVGKETAQTLITLLNSQNFEEFISAFADKAEAQEGITEIKELLSKLEGLGITNARFSQTLMRGFDYYTGIVFEIFDTNPDNRRSIFGGGQYDDLLAIFGAERIPAFGFGMGDVVISDVLAKRNLLPANNPSADLYLAVMKTELIDDAQELAQKLRESGLKVIVDYSGKKVGDQIQYADKQQIPFVTVIGDDEIKTGKFKVKRLSDGNETEVNQDSFINVIKANS